MNYINLMLVEDGVFYEKQDSNSKSIYIESVSKNPTIGLGYALVIKTGDTWSVRKDIDLKAA